jgi:glycosyltransferase involved in cell wall biosynthesis
VTATTFCTVIARNYMAHARVLSRSIHSHHMNAQVYVLVIDDEKKSLGDGDGGFHILRPKDIGLSDREFHQMAAIYGATELSTAVKPWLLRTLLTQKDCPVIYLDPDIEVFSSIQEIADLAEEHEIVLTPHTLSPIKRDGLSPSEQYILQAGIYNLGFIAVGSGSHAFLDWWGQRLGRDCIIAPTEGLFVDQRWVDFVPGYFKHHVFKSPSFNVAYWNADQRPVTWSGHRYEVLGEPLRFFHFSGFIPDQPNRLSKYVDRPRVNLFEYPVLAKLCRHYANRLLSMGYLEYSKIRYGLEYSAGGIRLDAAVRRIYRKSLGSMAEKEIQSLPDPFEPSQSDQFLEWLTDRANPDHPLVSRYLEGLYECRTDLKAAFPDLLGSGGKQLLEWARLQEYIPKELLGDSSGFGAGSSHQPIPKEPIKEGVNLVGYMRAESGVGEHARLIAATLRESGTPYSVLSYAAPQYRQGASFQDRGAGSPIFDTNILCVNADQLSNFVANGGAHLLRSRHTIGFWAWEVEEFPQRLRSCARLVDEIWANSEHARSAIARVISKPVHAFPLPIGRITVVPKSRAELGLPEGFLFLFCFDFLSVFERKNPIALVDAFREAFAYGEGPSLVIKSVNGDRKPEQLVALHARTLGRPDIYLMDGYLDEERQHALIANCDVYVSLHRAEGYGLTIAEAMVLGKPTIATAYSGNLEFMTQENSYLIPYELVGIPRGCEPYVPGGPWAEPDIQAAARAMRDTYFNSEVRRAKGVCAARDMRNLHSPAARVNLMLELLERSRSVPVALGPLRKMRAALRG